MNKQQRKQQIKREEKNGLLRQMYSRIICHNHRCDRNACLPCQKQNTAINIKLHNTKPFPFKHTYAKTFNAKVLSHHDQNECMLK